MEKKILLRRLWNECDVIPTGHISLFAEVIILLSRLLGCVNWDKIIYFLVGTFGCTHPKKIDRSRGVKIRGRPMNIALVKDFPQIKPRDPFEIISDLLWSISFVIPTTIEFAFVSSLVHFFAPRKIINSFSNLLRSTKVGKNSSH